MKIRDRIVKKGLVLSIILLFVGASVIPSISGTLRSRVFTEPIGDLNRDIIYVDNDSECPGNGTLEWPYCRIQYGIENASDGDLVYVYAGIYDENINVDKSIYLMGEDPENTIVNGENGEFVVKLQATHISIVKFSIDGRKRNGIRGIIVTGETNFISENIIMNCDIGVYIIGDETVDNLLTYNVIKDCNLSGVLLEDAGNNMITRNTITTTTSTEGGGIYITNSHGNVIHKNIIEECTNGVLVEGDSSTLNVIRYNKISGSTDYGIWFNHAGRNNVVLHNDFMYSSKNLGGNEDRNFEEYHYVSGNPTHAFFVNTRQTFWVYNYWDRARIIYIIWGKIFDPYLPLPWVNVDLLPAREPNYPD